MSLGVCRADEIDAQNALQTLGRDFCQIMAARPVPKGLPPYFQPPRNSTRWKPSGRLQIPVAPAGVDQLVFAERIPLGYDGVLIQVNNSWNGSGFVEGSGDITWRVKKDRVFVPYYEAITTTLGRLAVPPGEGQGIALFSGQLVQFYVNFQAGSEARLNGNGLTLCSFQGFTWPRDRVQT